MDLAATVTMLGLSRYASARRAGRNRELVRLANAVRGNGTATWIPVSMRDFKRAVMGHPLTADEVARLDFFLGDALEVDFSDPQVENFLDPIFSDDPWRARLLRLARRRSTFAEAAGAVEVGRELTLDNVRVAVRYIADSYIITSGQAELEVIGG